MQLDYEDSNPALTTGLSTQPQGALSAANQTQPKVNELLYDPTLINETVQQPKFGGSFDNLYSTTPATPVTPAPLSTPQFNFNGDPLYGSDPVGFDPNNLGFVADQATPDQTVPNISTIGNPFASFGGLDLNKPFKLPYNPTVSPPTTPDEQKQFDDYWAANPIDLGPNFMRNTFSEGFDLNSKTGFTLNSPEEQKRLNELDKIIDPLTQQILGQNLTSKWTGQGYGSPEANARDIAKLLNTAGITDIKQFGKLEGGGFGNKETGQAIESRTGRWQRQGGDDLFGGTGAGEGNTGYRVYIGEDGNPYFYTTQGSSSDLASIAPILAIAQFIPALAPFATAANAAIAASQGNVLGALAGAAGLGGYSDVANAANFAGAVKSGNPLSIISSGANLGGVDLGGVATDAGLGDISNIGGIDLKDATKAYQAVKAIQSGDPSAIISTIGGYIQDQNNQTPPSSPLDSLVPIPSDRSDTFSGLEEPVDRSIATRPIESSIDDVINPSDIPSIGGDPMDLLPQLPDLPQAPATGQTQDLSDKSFGSAFAQARASGAKEFLWNDNVYNTNLAPKQTNSTYDSVGGGRGGQGGPTAQEFARANAVRGNPPQSDFANWASSVFPSAQAGSVAGKAPDAASQIPGYGGPVPPSTYDQNNSMFGRVADELGLPQEFQRNVSNTLNALPGVNLPIGAAGRYVGAADDIGASKYLDDAGRYIPGSNAYKAPEYASEASRMTADPNRMFKIIDSLPNEIYKSPAVQEALQAAASGDGVKAFRLLESNPSTKKIMLEYAQKMGAQEVSPYKNINLFNPAEYISPARGVSGGLSPNPVRRGKR